VTDRTRLPWGLRLLTLVAPTLVVGLLLLGVELAVRASCRPISSLEAFVRSERQQAGFTDRRNVQIFEGDALLFWRLKPDLRDAIWDFTLVSTNAQRLRHRRPLRPKPPGSVRIVCLGDSVTFGYRVPLVFPDRRFARDPRQRPYPALVEDWLRRANPSRRIEVVALAVPGYTSQQGLAWARRDLDDLDPDILTVCFGWNDVDLREAPDRQAMRMGATWAALRRLLAGSQALIRASLWLEAVAYRRGTGALVPRVALGEYLGNHLEIARIARSQGTRVVVIGPVYRDAVTQPEEAVRVALYRRALRPCLRQHGIPYLQIDALTEAAYPENRRLFGEKIHPNHVGHRLLAEALLDFLAEQGMLQMLSLSWTRESAD